MLVCYASCGASYQFSSGVYSDDQATFRVASLGKDWVRTSVEKSGERSDLAWVHQPTGDLILSHAYCHDVKDKNLRSLARHMWIGLEKSDVIEQEFVTIHERKFLRTQVKTQLDGELLMLDHYMTRKAACVFDLAWVHRGHEQNEMLSQTFQDFVQGFEPIAP